MKKFLSILSLFILPTILFSQARVVLNNDGFIVIDNSAFVVLDNSNPNAITTMGTGGNILSEDETDVIQWEIGTTNGTYVIPWTTASGTKIPLTIDKTTAGTGATSEFILSTWVTASNNTPIPSAVTNMNFNGVDYSLNVVDRFWHIDALSYTAKPDVTLTIGYDDLTEMSAPNTISEFNLQAQRFNTGLSHWETYKLFGTVNTGANRVSGIVVPAADFFEDWILVDNTNPLPVTLLNFEANCENNQTVIKWVTSTEINNDYFVVEKSYDAQVFFELATVQGAGNSTTTQHYSVIDENISNLTTYYRLKQVDFDGTTTYHDIITTNCTTGGFNVTQVNLSNNTLSFYVESNLDENINVYLYDARGRIIASKKVNLLEGNNSVKLDNLMLSTGIYMMSIVGEFNKYSTKLMNR